MAAYAAQIDDDWTREVADVGDVDQHYVAAGPADGDLVLLLHGFPEFWYSWREQLPALAAAGYRVVAPDLRGYNLSDRPSTVSAYALDEHVADVAGLIRQFDRETAALVGHDWGGVIAWQVAIDRPELLDRLAILNAPHPSAYERELRSSLSQLRKSWYAFYFQLPRLPEWGFRWDDFAVFESLFRDRPVRSDAFTDDDVAAYKRAFDRPGALTAAIDYYRALFRRFVTLAVRRDGVGDQPVDVPTLVLWGTRDHALNTSLSRGLDRWVADCRVERYDDASHWVQFDARDRVAESLRTFL